MSENIYRLDSNTAYEGVLRRTRDELVQVLSAQVNYMLKHASYTGTESALREQYLSNVAYPIWEQIVLLTEKLSRAARPPADLKHQIDLLRNTYGPREELPLKTAQVT